MGVITVTLLATFFTQLGILLWKIAASSVPVIGKTRPLALVTGYLTHKQWMAGLVAMIAGWALFIHATHIGAISIVQPLMSTGDFFLVLMAVLFLGERLNRAEWKGLALTLIGASLLVFEVRPIAPVVIDWFNLGMFFLAGILCLGGAVLFIKKSRHQELPLAIFTGISFGMGAILTKVMTSYVGQHTGEPQPIDFVWNPIFPAVMLCNAVGLAVMQLAFQKGRASVIVPVELSVMNILVVVAGAAFFSEHISAFHFVCIALITGGAAYMHRGAKH